MLGQPVGAGQQRGGVECLVLRARVRLVCVSPAPSPVSQPRRQATGAAGGARVSLFPSLSIFFFFLFPSDLRLCFFAGTFFSSFIPLLRFISGFRWLFSRQPDLECAAQQLISLVDQVFFKAIF